VIARFLGAVLGAVDSAIDLNLAVLDAAIGPFARFLAVGAAPYGLGGGFLGGGGQLRHQACPFLVGD